MTIPDPNQPPERFGSTLPSLDPGGPLPDLEIGGALPELSDAGQLPDLEGEPLPEVQAPPPAPEPPSAPQPGDEDFGFAEYAGDIGLGLVSGVEDTFMGLYGLLDLVTADLLPDWTEKTIDAPSTFVGKFAGQVSQFAVGFLLMGGALNGVARVASALQLTGVAAAAAAGTGSGLLATGVRGALTDFAFFQKQEATLANAIQDTPLANPVTEFLAIDKDDGEIEGRIKAALEGFAMGGIFDTFVSGLKQMRKARRSVEALGPDAPLEALDAAVAKAMDAHEVVAAAEKSGNAARKKANEAFELVTKDAKTQKSEAILQAVGLGELKAIHAAKEAFDSMDPKALAKRVYKGLWGDEEVGLGLTQLEGLESVASTVRAFETVVPQPARATADQVSEAATKMKNWLGMNENSRQSYVMSRLDDGGLSEEAALGKILGTMHTDMIALKLTLDDWGRKLAGSADAYDTMGVEELLEHGMRGRVLNDFIEVVRRPRSAMGRTFRHMNYRIRKGLNLRATDGGAQTPEAVLNGQYRRAVKEKSPEEQLKVLTGAATTEGAKRKMKQQLKLMHAAVDAAGGDLDKAMPAIANAARVDNSFTRPFAKTQEYWYSALLSGWKTHIANISSNAGTLIQTPTEIALGASLRGAGVAITGRPMLGYGIAKEGFQAAWDQIAGFSSAFAEGILLKGDAGRGVKEAFNTGTSHILRDSGSALAMETRGITPQITKEALDDSLLFTAFRGIFGKNAADTAGEFFGAAGSVIRTPGRLLAAEDELFKQMHVRGALNAHFRKNGRRLLESGQISSVSDYVQEQLSLTLHDGALLDEMKIQELALKHAVQVGTAKGYTVEQIGQAAAEVTEQMMERTKDNLAAAAKANRQGEYRTFTDAVDKNNLIEQGARGLAGMKRSVPFLQFFIPFINTPAKILSYAHERLPLEQVFGAAHYMRDKMRGGPMSELGNRTYKALQTRKTNPEEFENLLARFAQGVGATTVLSKLAMDANDPSAPVALYGRGPEDYKERLVWETGKKWKPYSIRIGDTYVSYERLEPFSTILGTIADAVQFTGEDGVDDLGHVGYGVASAITANFTQKSYLTGVENLVNILVNSDENSLDGAWRQFVGSFVPAAVSQLNDAAFQDEMVEVRTVLDKIGSRIPGFSTGMVPGFRNLDERRDVMGYSMKKRGWADDDWVLSRGLPFSATSIRASKVHKELARLNHPWDQAQPKTRVGGVAVDLREWRNERDQSALDRYRELSGTIRLGGKTLEEKLESVLSSKRYQALPDVESGGDIIPPKVQVFQSIISAYRSRAKQEMLKEFPDIIGSVKEQRRTIFDL